MLGRWGGEQQPKPVPLLLLSHHPWSVPNPPTAECKRLWVARGSCLTTRCNTTLQLRTGNEGGCICRGNLSAQTAITCAGVWPEPRSSKRRHWAGRRRPALRCCGVKHSSGGCLGPCGSCPNLVWGGWKQENVENLCTKGKFSFMCMWVLH